MPASGAMPDVALELERGERLALATANQARVEVPHPLRIVTQTELSDLRFPPRMCLLHPWVREREAFMVAGWRGSGKTQLAVGLAVSIATGTRFLKWHAPSPRKVLYIDGEMGGDILQERMNSAMLRATGQTKSDHLRVLTFDLQAACGMPNLADPEGQALVEGHLEDEALIMLDNLDCLVQSDFEGNSEESWIAVQRWILRLRARGVAVGVVHHFGKNRQQRGTSRKESILDVSIDLRQPPDYTQDQGARFEIHFTKARRLFGEDVQAFEAWLRGDRRDPQAGDWVVRE